MKGKQTFTPQESATILELIRKKLLADSRQQKTIRNEIRALGFYASDFGLNGGYDQDDFLRVTGTDLSVLAQKLRNPEPVQKAIERKGRAGSDESYVLDLCDNLLEQRSLRQHCFSFLTGDTGKTLPVDAYYPSLSVVIEYQEKQHTSGVSFWDKKQTISGVPRAEQRRIYDQRRCTILPENGIQLLIIDYTDLVHEVASKKLIRDVEADKTALAAKLKSFLP